MAKSLFNLYLDDSVKQKAMAKLIRLNGETTKGQLASFIRVKINEFVQTPDEEVDKKKDREQNYRSNTMYGYLIFSSEYCGCIAAGCGSL